MVGSNQHLLRRRRHQIFEHLRGIAVVVDDQDP
jgi:hypothetical protein